MPVRAKIPFLDSSKTVAGCSRVQGTACANGNNTSSIALGKKNARISFPRKENEVLALDVFHPLQNGIRRFWRLSAPPGNLPYCSYSSSLFRVGTLVHITSACQLWLVSLCCVKLPSEEKKGCWAAIKEERKKEGAATRHGLGGWEAGTLGCYCFVPSGLSTALKFGQLSFSSMAASSELREK